MKYFKYIVIALVSAAVLFAVLSGAAWVTVRQQPNSGLSRTLSKNLAIPAARVGGHTVLLSEVHHRSVPGDSASFAQSFASAVRREQITVLAASHNAEVPKAEIESAYKRTEDAAGGSSKLEALTKKEGLTLGEFKSSVLVPQLTLEHLAVAFYADQKENAAAHRSAAEITDRLKAGQNFATLSKMYSKDEASAAMGGLDDAPGQLLPEVEAKLKTAKAGDTLTVASRRGLHVIRVGEAGQPLEQIYIPGSDFQQWLTTQLAAVPVQYLVAH